ncbi:hypothetical protein bbp_180 [Buchnera aphidicola str. Bp (Baizongia pistaciae)]|uniref:Ribosome-binding ATPase YchF n=1 Tax=Buchnera aphidicola subsp. Baizongia pistaciae (strain Bp) TaxID=224915 RepID=YCHF_BUCBP|nr:redox-regulated ATPase YchF [Buchnera aphidicola]Q89AR6.3 RecName: Full=Ribosome-binding ATPase YchF [Buchnera aphidicola str. Bp (Baizongia pistaciae)]AAO26912.1 hypothetical protein bbp_180 [Buchnera aphidicola str. Bp (Baizongia pistaciae)]
MGFKCGFVGLPNVGKSTLFNYLTKLNIPADNYPFCTIKSNVGIVPVLDNRLNKIAQVVCSNKIIPATIELVDIAGLVKGAYKGEGLGNQFLDHIRDTNVIMHIVRCFENRYVTHIYGSVDPVRDVQIINLELILSDIEVCKNRMCKLEINKLSHNKQVNKELLILKKCVYHLEKSKSLRSLNLTEEEIFVINYLRLITLKPVVYIFNISIDQSRNLYKREIFDIIKNEHNAKTVNVCLDLMQSSKNDVSAYDHLSLKYKQLFNKMLKNVIWAGFNALNLITFFTAGKKEVHAWTTTNNLFIFQSVKCIHTDLSKGFIRAQVISYDDFIKYKGEKRSKELGKIRIEGKRYVICDGDIIHVLYNV